MQSQLRKRLIVFMILLFSSVALVACGSSSKSTADGTSGQDTSTSDTSGVDTTSAPDTSGVDTTSAPDTSGVDTTSAPDTSGEDTSTPPDTSTEDTASPDTQSDDVSSISDATDATVDEDTSSGDSVESDVNGQTDLGSSDSEGDLSSTDTSGPTLCPESYATNTGCSTFDDHTGDQGTVVIKMGDGSFTFSPKCVMLKVGQAVNFEVASGTFKSPHPLRQACGPVDGVFFSNLDASTLPEPIVLTADHVGLFGLYCNFHGSAANGTGMAAMIKVVP